MTRWCDTDSRSCPWHRLTAEAVAGRLHACPEGLSADEAAQRLARVGPNALAATRRKSWSMLFFNQFKDFMILVLLAAAVVAGLIGEASDTIAIVVIVVLNAVLGFVQEYRAEKAMAALQKMAAVTATLVRDGRLTVVNAERIVPGDVVVLEAGNVVPADLRLTEAVQLQTQEAALTGESLPVGKHVEALEAADLPIGDRGNMAYKGTMVTGGRGRGIVTATGMATELGRIAVLLEGQPEGKTPLQKRLTAFGQKLAYCVLAICAVVFIAGLLQGNPPLLMLLTAISLAVAAIPEALPAVITIALALGAGKLARQSALIRKLPAVETLGSVTYICSDKTGTLTLNQMAVEQVYCDGCLAGAAELDLGKDEADHASRFPATPAGLLLTGLCLCSDARRDAAGALIGDPTETALVRLAVQKGLAPETRDEQFPRLAEIPFEAGRKRMTTFHPWPNGQVVAFTKGAVEELVARCDTIQRGGRLEPLDRQDILAVTDRIAGQGLRALGLGLRVWDKVPEPLTPATVEKGLTLVGIVGMMDPPRPEAAEAVALCRSAGIRPVMITGDHPLTARVIARRLGISDEDADAVITGTDIERLTTEQFSGRVETIRVYARVAPEQKLKIVKALQDKGQFVAMTGDGVNDAPALKQADIGVAMGITGTDVAKEAAHMILLDDNFATVVKTVKEGRRIFDNIRKFIKYTMTSNSGEIWTIFLAPLLGLPVPLLPIHILWVNLVTDGVPGLALAAEPAEPTIMQRPPRHPGESIFAHGLGAHIIWVGLLMGAVCILTQAWFIHASPARWQTMVFTVLCLSQMGNVLSIRSARESFFSQGALSNKPLLGAVLLTFALQMATIYVPLLNRVFKTQPLSLGELAVTILLSAVVFVAVEVEKAVKRRNGGSAKSTTTGGMANSRMG